jgi:hypothetical protein
MPRGFKPLHPALALTRRPGRVLTAVIEIATRTMLDTGPNRAFGRRVALQFIRDDDARHVRESFEKFFEKCLRRLLMAPALPDDIENVVVLIDSPPQVIACTVEGQKHLIEEPFVTRLGPTASELVGIVLSELLTPSATSFMRDDHAAFEQQFLNVAVTQVKSIIEIIRI